MKDKVEDLRGCVERVHNCSAHPVRAEPVSECFEGATVWVGTVHVFDLDDPPTATTAYAWSSPVEGSDRRRFYAVLGVPPINSAADAVRAAIVADRKAGRPA